MLKFDFLQIADRIKDMNALEQLQHLIAIKIRGLAFKNSKSEYQKKKCRQQLKILDIIENNSAEIKDTLEKE